MLPMNTVVVSRVAELPTCQSTLHACAPLINWTVAPGAVMRVLPIWKMKTLFGSLPPSRIKLPVRKAEDE